MSINFHGTFFDSKNQLEGSFSRLQEYQGYYKKQNIRKTGDRISRPFNGPIRRDMGICKGKWEGSY